MRFPDVRIQCDDSEKLSVKSRNESGSEKNRDGPHEVADASEAAMKGNAEDKGVMKLQGNDGQYVILKRSLLYGQNRGMQVIERIQVISEHGDDSDDNSDDAGQMQIESNPASISAVNPD